MRIFAALLLLGLASESWAENGLRGGYTQVHIRTYIQPDKVENWVQQEGAFLYKTHKECEEHLIKRLHDDWTASKVSKSLLLSRFNGTESIQCIWVGWVGKE